MVEKLGKRFSNPFFIAAFVFAILIYGGILKVKVRHPFYSLSPEKNIVAVRGKIISNPQRDSKGKFYSVVLDAESCTASLGAYFMESRASGHARCLVPSFIVEALYPGKLYSDFGKTMVVEKGEGAIFYGSWKNGIFLVSDGASLEIPAGKILGTLVRLRSFSRLQFKRLMFSWKNAGGFILALLCGSREYTEKKLSENFRNAGLSHILALSGMHLSFFAGIAGGTGKIFGKKFNLYFRLAGILFFVWFAGLSPSLLRALICSLLMLACSAFFSHEADGFNILSSAFLIHCIIAPSDIFSVAFILSYCAFGGILLFSDFFNSFICIIMPKKISVAFSSSLGAQIAAAPASIVMFGCIMPLGIFAGVAVSPMVSFFIFVALISIFICLMLPFLAPSFGCIMNALYEIISLTVHFFALVPPISFR